MHVNLMDDVLEKTKQKNITEGFDAYKTWQ